MGRKGKRPNAFLTDEYNRMAFTCPLSSRPNGLRGRSASNREPVHLLDLSQTQVQPAALGIPQLQLGWETSLEPVSLNLLLGPAG